MNDIKQAISTPQKNRTIFKIAHPERGQAMVETAFVMIILLLLLSVIIDLGRALFTYLALQNAVAEGAYYAAKEPVWVDSSNNPDPNNIKFRVKHESPDSPEIDDSPLVNWEDVDDDEITVTFSCGTTPHTNFTVPSGSMVVVSVSYSFETIGPVAGMLAFVVPDTFSDWDGTFLLRAETRQIVLKEANTAAGDCN